MVKSSEASAYYRALKELKKKKIDQFSIGIAVARGSAELKKEKEGDPFVLLPKTRKNYPVEEEIRKITRNLEQFCNYETGFVSCICTLSGGIESGGVQ